MFIGHHFDVDDLVFQSATVVLSDLDSWCVRSGITVEEEYLNDRSAPNALYAMSFVPLPEESCSFSRGRVTLAFRWKSGGDPTHGIEFQQWPVIKIEYNEMQPLGVIQKDLGRVQNLVTLCIDAPTAVDNLFLYRPDIRVKMLSGEDAPEQQSIEFIASPLQYVQPQDRKPRHWHQMLLSYEELGGVAAIARWLDASQQFQRALDSFMSIKHAKQIFAENRFLNVTFAAEAFHRNIQDLPHMDEETFTRLLDSYVESTPDEHLDWLRGKIRNEPTLRKRLQLLAARSVTATRPLIGDKDRWAYTLSQVRNELTHLGNNSQTFDGSDLHFLAESVYAVVRICMLIECGVPLETLTEKANSPAIAWYRDRLLKAIERVRKQVH